MCRCISFTYIYVLINTKLKKSFPGYHCNIWLDKRSLIKSTSDDPIIPELGNSLVGSLLFFCCCCCSGSGVGLINLFLLTLEQFQCTYVTSGNIVFDSQVSKQQWRRHWCMAGLFCINKCHINILGALRMMIMIDPNWQWRSVLSFVIGRCVEMFSLYCSGFA